jgi:hypothetical protein
MPKTKHDLLKRKTAQVYIKLDGALVGTIELYETFAPQHPDLSEALRQVAEGIDMCQILLTAFWKESWGDKDPRWESWI